MKIIRYFRLDGPVFVKDGVEIRYGEIALSEEELWEKLNGDTAEIVFPPPPWYVRLWQKVFPADDSPINRVALLKVRYGAAKQLADSTTPPWVREACHALYKSTGEVLEMSKPTIIDNL